MKNCDFCFKNFDFLEEIKDGAETYKVCKNCLEKYKLEQKKEGGEDTYAP